MCDKTEEIEETPAELIAVGSYNNDWASYLAVGLALMFVCLGVGGCVYLSEKGTADKTRAEAGR